MELPICIFPRIIQWNTTLKILNPHPRIMFETVYSNLSLIVITTTENTEYSNYFVIIIQHIIPKTENYITTMLQSNRQIRQFLVFSNSGVPQEQIIFFNSNANQSITRTHHPN
ncbi:unnamed protein product [Coffea canephora]|uniref:Uncharacterized protein n=1 Tax=Coffea canephora TaxID=49390 RepID=A0A068TT46_COFCA|nr:unnamed protein product [Coffea canephora]